jgi:hypothetical protein
MNKHILLSALGFFVCMFCACGKEPDVPDTAYGPKAYAAPMASQAVKKEEAPYVYKGAQRPDPFVPLNIETAIVLTGEIVIPNISTLSLKGIFSLGKQRTAIIAGVGTTYLLKDSRLYDNRQRLIKGISGAVKKDSVILIAQDKTMRELKLHDKE